MGCRLGFGLAGLCGLSFVYHRRTVGEPQTVGWRTLWGVRRCLVCLVTVANPPLEGVRCQGRLSLHPFEGVRLPVGTLHPGPPSRYRLESRAVGCEPVGRYVAWVAPPWADGDGPRRVLPEYVRVVRRRLVVPVGLVFCTTTHHDPSKGTAIANPFDGLGADTLGLQRRMGGVAGSSPTEVSWSFPLLFPKLGDTLPAR